MKTAFRKTIAVLLCVCMALGVCSTGAFAQDDSKVITVSCKEELESLDFDAPVILVDGVGGEFYKKNGTETTEDDEKIWGMSTDVILGVLKENIGKILMLLILNDYEGLCEVVEEIAEPIFGDFSCDENGVPNPDTYRDETSDYELQNGYGYGESYTFVYDWRLDMHTISTQLDEYVNYIMELTGSDKVVLTAMSMGTGVLMTYLYEYYYTAENYADRNHIESVVFIAGAMNGVAVCADPFSGKINIDSTSLMRMLSEVMVGDETMETIYNVLEVLYNLGALEPLVWYLNNLTRNLLENGFNESVLDTIATVGGFYGLMSPEQYADARAYIFDTPEKQEKYAGLLSKTDYYHEKVQVNGENIIKSLLADGINTAIIAEYGYTMIPLTSDNDRMTDGVIMTAAESFGATCAEVDGTLGEGYTQAKECACGGNHVSADNQIDASTCAFPDITWFGKYLRHTCDDDYFEDLINLIVYSDEQKTVWSYSEFPQFLVNLDGESLVPLTAENAGVVVAYEETTPIGKFFAKIKSLFKF